MSSIIDTLSQVLGERRTASPESSYTASLFAGGLSAISAKLHEELEEFIEAAENLESAGNSQGTDAALIHEAADLWFHSMVLLTHYGASPALVLDELEQRFGTSGHEEKRLRTTENT